MKAVISIVFLFLFTKIDATDTSEDAVAMLQEPMSVSKLISAADPATRLATTAKEPEINLLEEDADEVEQSELLWPEVADGHMLNDLLEIEKVSVETLHKEEAQAEKLDVHQFDCADEVVLRLAIADSFHGPSYDRCVEDLTAKTFAPGGSGEQMMAPPQGGSGSGGSGMTKEQVEQRVVRRCITRQGHGVALGPRLIRLTFHDAADYNNSAYANGTAAPLDQTGVDSCLRTALLAVGLEQKDDDDNLEEIAKGDPNHNRGLRNAEKWVLNHAAASHLSQPDIQVLGAITAMEAWLDGPELGATFGRTKGHCQKIACTKEKCWDQNTPFFKQPVAESVGNGMFCPATNTLQPLRTVLGLSHEELIALQGAHSVGGVIVCSGLGNVAKGPYCDNKCSLPPGNFWETGNLDGTSFDDTPGKLDNRYYQLLVKEKYEELPACDEIKHDFPSLSKFGFKGAGNKSVGGSGASRGKDKSATCSRGAKYEPENTCEVQSCVDTCANSEACVLANDADSDLAEGDLGADDLEQYRAAWAGCIECKMKCSGSHSKRLAKTESKDKVRECIAGCPNTPACVQSNGFVAKDCRDACKTGFTNCTGTVMSSEDLKAKVAAVRASCKSCRSLKRSAKKECKSKCKEAQAELKKVRAERTTARDQCRTARTSCQASCNAQQGVLKVCRGCKRECRAEAAEHGKTIYNSTGMSYRPARWCKRLSAEKKCLNSSIKLPINGGWGACPKEMQMSFPNVGAGRLTIIQNLERWTKFHGLFKRVMVLPSDWSHLGSEQDLAVFQRYAADENDWKTMFKEAWTKTSSLGYDKSLVQCKKVACTDSSDSISCPVDPSGFGNWGSDQAKKRMQAHRKFVGLPDFVRPTELVFKKSVCDPPMTSASGCEIVGGYGVKAKISCAGYSGYCVTDAAAATVTRIANEWKEGGGQVPQCEAPAPSMLSSDVTLVEDVAEDDTEDENDDSDYQGEDGEEDDSEEDTSVFLQGEVDIEEDDTDDTVSEL